MTATPANAAGRLHRRRFRFRLWPTLAALLGAAVLPGLGTWQLQRLAWKTDLIVRAEAGLAAPLVALPTAGADLEALDFRHVTARGVYLHDAAFAFGLSASGGEPGGRLVTPLRLDDGRVVLVDRGWLPEDLLPPNVPEALRPSGQVTLEGVARWRGGGGRERGWMVPDDQPDRRRWFSWDIPAMERALGVPLLPVTLALERSKGPIGLPQAQRMAVDFHNNHLGYALTWYGLAAGLLVIFVLSSSAKPDEPPS
ncbi:MAG TPA: SURF1 family protein [Geminicoccaceae bacterium]|nr:SURF1 family protein [Geminicoccaceae bacterium]